jgi:hypothetical protein
MAQVIFQNVVSETEKAICVSLKLVHPHSETRFEKKQWFPKSVAKQIGDDVLEVADWFSKKMVQEQCAFFGVSLFKASDIFMYTQERIKVIA